MNQEKFVNTYIELLTATVTESIQKNIILQAQKKVSEQEVSEVSKALAESEMKKVNDQNFILVLKQEINDLKKQKNSIISETNEVKKSSEHLDTFKQELIKSKKAIEKLNEQIDDMSGQLEEKQKTIEELTKEIAKLLKPGIEAKRNTEKETVEDSGTF